jgi:hypothetical protein
VLRQFLISIISIYSIFYLFIIHLLHAQHLDKSNGTQDRKEIKITNILQEVHKFSKQTYKNHCSTTCVINYPNILT